MARDRTRPRSEQEPPAAGRRPGPGLLAVRDALRAALLPPGRRRRGLPGPGRQPVGARHRRPAAARPDRRRPGPPAGRQPHVLGDLGRPHAARQAEPRASAPSWSERRRRSSSTHTPDGASQAGSSPAATPAASRGVCWNGSPYQPVPVATRRHQGASPCASSSSPRTTPACSPSSRTSAPTRAPSASTSPTCSATSARSPRTSTTRRRATTTARSTAPRRRPRRRREAVRRVAARAARLPPRRGRLDGPGAGRRLRRSRATPGDTLVTSIDAKVQARRRAAARRARSTASATQSTRSPAATTPPTRVPPSCWRRRPAGSSRWPASRRTTPTSGSAASARSSSTRLYSEKAGTPLLVARHPGPVRAGLDVEAVHDRRRADQRLHARTPRSTCSSGFQVGNRVFKNYESGAVRLHRLRQGARGLLQHLLLPGRLRLLAAVRQRRRRRRTPRTRWSRRPRSSASARATGIDLPGEAPGRIADRNWKRAYYESHEGLLLRHRRQAAGRQDQRLRLQVRPRVLHRGLRLPRRRRRELRDRAGRHHRHAAPARPGLRRARATAAPSTSPASPRRSSAPSGEVLRRIAPRKVAGQVDVPEDSTSTTSTARSRA